MKIVLLQDVKALGKKGEIVDASDGYARNFILPKKLGVEASEANLAALAKKKAAEARLAAEQLAEAKALAEKLGGVKVMIPVKVGSGGKLFGAIASKEIADALAAQTGIEIDKKKIVLDNPIKVAGATTVPVKLFEEVKGAINVIVEAQ